MRGYSAEPAPLAALARLPFHVWLVVAVTCIGAFIGQLDASIVQLALPELTRTFDSSVNDVRWVAIAYLLSYAAFLPVFGRVCEMYGRKLLYLVGFALFGLASLACGWAPDLTWLIVLRALQGMGGSLLGANSITILVKSVDPERRPHAIGFFTAAQAIGVSLGPVIGGLLLDSMGWRWIFWVAVPLALAAVVLGWMILPRTAEIEGDKTFDWPGAFLLAPSLFLTVLALNQLSVWPLLSPAMILCLVGAVAFMVLFARYERWASCPLVDTTLFGRNPFTAGIIGVALGYALLYGMLFLMAFALMHGFHDSARLAGLKLAVIPIALGVVAPLGISLSKRWGVNPMRAAGMSACLAALAICAFLAFHPIGSLAMGLSAFAVFGIGLGLFMAPNSHSTIDAAPPHHAGTASALVNLMRVLGSCLGVSAASSVMSWRMAQSVGRDRLDILLGGRPLIDAVESSLFVLAIFAAIAACTSLVRVRQPAQAPGGL